MPNGFLLAASSLGLPPRPLKNPPPPDETAVLAELEPKRLPDDGCCWEININSKICLEEREFKKFPKVGLTKKKKKKKDGSYLSKSTATARLLAKHRVGRRAAKTCLRTKDKFN